MHSPSCMHAAAKMASKPPQPTSLAGTVLQHRYHLTKLIGKGSFADVYLALDSHAANKPVAVKVMDLRLIVKHKLTQHILREIAIMKRLRHPNIVHLHQIIASKSKVFLIMEFVAGGELYSKISKGRISESAARRYFHQLITAVDFCHSRHVFHRDLKLQNLLLDDKTGLLKVTDFGLSVVVEERRSDDSFLLKEFVGTPAFMAPEVVRRQGYDGAKVDIWSCGVVLFVLMAGHLPFQGKNRYEVYEKIEKGNFRCPTWFSPDLILLLQGILCADPNRRMAMSEIKKHPWFKKDYKDLKFFVDDDEIHIYDDECGSRVNEDVETEEVSDSGYESDSSIASTLPTRQQENPVASRLPSVNAFDIISFSTGFDLSGFFDETGEQKRFLTSCSVDRAVMELLKIAKLVSYKVRTKDTLMILQGTKEGPKGPLTIAVEISQLTSDIVVLQVKKKAGNLAEYNEFLDNVLKPKLKHLVESPLIAANDKSSQTPSSSPAHQQKPPLPAKKSVVQSSQEPSSSRPKSPVMERHIISPGYRSPSRMSPGLNRYLHP